MVNSFISRKAQISTFPATFEENVRRFAMTISPYANTITVPYRDIPPQNARQVIMNVDSEADKYRKIRHMYGLLTASSSIIFCAKRETEDDAAETSS